MTVIETEGGFVVVGDSSPNDRRTLAGPFPTNAEAWRAADRLENSPVSPAEKRADWISNKILSSGPMPVGPKKKTKRERKQAKAAAKAPRWVRDIAAAKFDPHGNRQHREWQLGTFGAASPVRKIDPADYLALKGQPS
ncbi:hypothetical protein [Mesorhizobium sp.]|nr:hypothetical protein [Mesorhizobium sp.]RWH55452.1 MAG: hypothetical protein EOQ82_16365 [Mesorhizobium sp.]RWI66158.1 MAG: hypothetical protein EOR19_32220 [Mesorhizobium sp.]RWI71522.1 MAG: hypothetical protein EOR18_15995 [Mesorhizobium sp.]RWJ29660.1 MAG: hypothetical protein EOR28_20850 [Mesorhizobium sp.]RWJ49113.1 MAG: hypothetical protein EOR31_09125 [Mesorhizobium sp.]